MAIEVPYFNSFVLKRLQTAANVNTFPTWLSGSPDNSSANQFNEDGVMWYLEEARMRGGYNNTNVDYGVRAYIVEDDTKSQQLSNGLIYSGIFNSKTGVNNSNVFSVGDAITKR